MTSSLDVAQDVDVIEDLVRAVVGKRLGEYGFALDAELTALGVDSLLLLRIIADVAADPTAEIEVEQLADLRTVADLCLFLNTARGGNR